LSFELAYKRLLHEVLDEGNVKQTRNGPTLQVFGKMLTIRDLKLAKFPVLTSRKMFYKPVLGELAAFLRGATLLQTFKHFGCNYWDANANAWYVNKTLREDQKEIGLLYGAKWRNFHGVDQLTKLVRGLQDEPHSRRHVLTAYDPSETFQCLPPCHLLAQFNCTGGGDLDCCVYMRSVDLIHGLPSDIILYAALQIIIANQIGGAPGKLVFALGDAHIYENHQKLIHEYLERQSLDLPYYTYNQKASIDTFVPDDLELLEYKHGERIDFPFNV